MGKLTSDRLGTAEDLKYSGGLSIVTIRSFKPKPTSSKETVSKKTAKQTKKPLKSND